MDNLKRILFDTWNEWGVSSTLNRISRKEGARSRNNNGNSFHFMRHVIISVVIHSFLVPAAALLSC